ncbi:MAG TPA: CpsD/CapB family tyrosine-protein kinase [Thermoanaerobaculia bacterium]|nr:CpsD/CapB family tyrosine-protein kinase [Thermoanaerobaculia bacterium]
MDLPLTRPPRLEREGISQRTIRVKEGVPLILHADPPSFVAEQFRSLAVHVEERINPIGTWGYVLTVTSPEEGEGKTLTSINVALTLTRGEERRVLLLEGDLWRPQLPTYFDGVGESLPGLQQVLDRAISLPEAVLSVEGTSLDVLFAGTTHVTGDKMSGRRMSEVLAEARAAYEVVVIDSPPMELLASARSLAARSDGVLLVVRANQTRKRSVEKTLATLGPEKMVGVVLNGVRLSNKGYRGYY